MSSKISTIKDSEDPETYINRIATVVEKGDNMEEVMDMGNSESNASSEHN